MLNLLAHVPTMVGLASAGKSFTATMQGLPIARLVPPADGAPGSAG